ncbi:hypothetical protein [Azospirillum canadense]|uniref:hypothetical protein n=1 Tax=Azospirillum canadense TaxID=403962 RepID=UPI002226F2FA|nr:hypothetical protein [Azospirillum canadense]MCW2241524.1 hypothetical protein [Azospirillum canadense]
MLRSGLVLAVFALGAHAALAQESGRLPALVEGDVTPGVQAILTLYQADGAGEALPALRQCYDTLDRGAPVARVSRCLAMDVALCLVLDVRALNGDGPVDDFCEAGRSGRRLAYWADETIAIRADRPAFLKILFTLARAGMAGFFRRGPQTGDPMP